MRPVTSNRIFIARSIIIFYRSMNSSIIFFLLVVNQKKKSSKYHAVKSFLTKEILFHSLVFQSDHIVPPDNVLAIALPSGPKNIEFEFTAVNRSNTAMVDSYHGAFFNLRLYMNYYLDG